MIPIYLEEALENDEGLVFLFVEVLGGGAHSVVLQELAAVGPVMENYLPAPHLLNLVHY
jgi:hypothetical protein